MPLSENEENSEMEDLSSCACLTQQRMTKSYKQQLFGSFEKMLTGFIHIASIMKKTSINAFKPSRI